MGAMVSNKVHPISAWGSNDCGKLEGLFMDSKDQLLKHKETHTKQNSWWLNDIQGIPVSRVCDECIDAVKAQYNPAIFGEGDESYEDVVEEPIDEDY